MIKFRVGNSKMLIDNISIVRQKRKTLKIVINTNADILVYCPINLSIER